MRQYHAAIVTQSAGEEDVFQEYLEMMGDDKEASINVRPMAEEEAVTALENGDIDGIFTAGKSLLLQSAEKVLPRVSSR